MLPDTTAASPKGRAGSFPAGPGAAAVGAALPAWGQRQPESSERSIGPAAGRAGPCCPQRAGHRPGGPGREGGAGPGVCRGGRPGSPRLQGAASAKLRCQLNMPPASAPGRGRGWRHRRRGAESPPPPRPGVRARAWPGAELGSRRGLRSSGRAGGQQRLIKGAALRNASPSADKPR